MGARKAEKYRKTALDVPEYPLSNVKSTAGPGARAVKKKRVSTKFEIDKL
jgi:hypothetical protein